MLEIGEARAFCREEPESQLSRMLEMRDSRSPIMVRSIVRGCCEGVSEKGEDLMDVLTPAAGVEVVSRESNMVLKALAV